VKSISAKVRVAPRRIDAVFVAHHGCGDLGSGALFLGPQV
jgi:hypothetical protein